MLFYFFLYIILTFFFYSRLHIFFCNRRMLPDTAALVAASITSVTLVFSIALHSQYFAPISLPRASPYEQIAVNIPQQGLVSQFFFFSLPLRMKSIYVRLHLVELHVCCCCVNLSSCQQVVSVYFRRNESLQGATTVHRGKKKKRNQNIREYQYLISPLPKIMTQQR